jgi:hypothetical protein
MSRVVPHILGPVVRALGVLLFSCLFLSPSFGQNSLMQGPEGGAPPIGCFQDGGPGVIRPGQWCGPAQPITNCKSTRALCDGSSNTCQPQEICLPTGVSCTDPIGGMRTGDCDPPPTCNATSCGCVQGPAVVCPPVDLVSCKKYQCDPSSKGTCMSLAADPVNCQYSETIPPHTCGQPYTVTRTITQNASCGGTASRRFAC